MSNVMDRGVINMPYELAMSTDLARRQYYNRAKAIYAELAALKQRLEGAQVVTVSRPLQHLPNGDQNWPVKFNVTDSENDPTYGVEPGETREFYLVPKPDQKGGA